MIKTIDKERFNSYVNEIIDIDCEISESEIKSEVKKNTNRVLLNEIIPNLIEKNLEDKKEKKSIRHDVVEYRKRILYETSGEIQSVIKNDMSETEDLYVPPATVEFTKFERLAFPALVGSILFGILFHMFLGPLFAEKMYSVVVGMPLGASLFVWLFAKSIRHPKIAKVLKWATVVGFVGLTIGMVYTNIRGGIFGKLKVNFFQWLWLAIITLMIFWMLHIFKPVKTLNTLEIKTALKMQVNSQLKLIMKVCQIIISNNINKQNGKIKIKNEKQIDTEIERVREINSSKEDIKIQNLVNGKFVPPTLEQMLISASTNDSQAALNSVKSFLNALSAQGIVTKSNDSFFVFSDDDKDCYDTFGIVNIGDEVEKMYNSWIDSTGKTMIRGLVRKVRK